MIPTHSKYCHLQINKHTLSLKSKESAQLTLTAVYSDGRTQDVTANSSDSHLYGRYGSRRHQEGVIDGAFTSSPFTSALSSGDARQASSR
jgi:hypothetical protein